MHAPEFWNGRGSGASLLSALLSPLGVLYGYSVRFKQRRARPFRPRARVLCVGNLTAGGSGKTPIAIAIARLLSARGAKVVFLTRGYGGRLEGPVEADPALHSAADTGDEPLLLAAVAQTIVSRDRAKGAQACDALGADVIVMDDGHQNFQIAKDLSLVAAGSKESFGNGRIVPAGPLREPVAQGLARADAVICMGSDCPTLPFAGPVFRARAVALSPESLRGASVFAFAGIADPKRFFDLVAASGAAIAGQQVFPDHHPFTRAEIIQLRQAAEERGARLVTTEKDFVRLAPDVRAGLEPVAICAMFDDEAQIAALLDRIYPPRNKADP